ncbi:MAG: hypothetical protein LBD06_00770 [Candidatus Accumulibacter sp.]|nr:hypothetical protein [Accumulibacter sp.]
MGIPAWAVCPVFCAFGTGTANFVGDFQRTAFRGQCSEDSVQRTEI